MIKSWESIVQKVLAKVYRLILFGSISDPRDTRFHLLIVEALIR